MTGKCLLTASLLLPFMLISSIAHADSTTAKKRYLANEQRNYPSSESSGLNRTATRAEVGTPRLLFDNDFGPSTGRCAYQYQGGPKSSLWTCRR